MDLGYQDFLIAHGLTDEAVNSISENTNDLSDYENNDVFIGKSNIHGKGVFSSVVRVKGDVIGPARLNDKRTQLGRWVNHSKNPNCEVFKNINDNLFARAITSIEKNDEITYDYAQVLSVNKHVSTFDFHSIIKNYIPGLDYSKYDNNQKVEIMEWILSETMENIADELPVRQMIFAGMYHRELSIPAGTVLTGKIHPLAHIFTLVKGKLIVLKDDGIIMIDAPFSFTVQKNTKKIGYAVSDCICTTVNTTDKTTIEDAEAESLVDSDLSWVETLYNEHKKVIECQV